MKRLLVAAAAVAMLAAACGDAAAPEPDATPTPTAAAATAPTTAAPDGAADSVGGTAATAPDDPAVAASAVESDWPAVRVIDLAGGEVSLPTLAPAPLPTLLWFWAPH